MLNKIFPAFSPSAKMRRGPLSCDDKTALAIPPKNPVFSAEATFSPVFKLYVDLQKSQDNLGADPVSSLAGRTLALVKGILHWGHAESKQCVSPSYFVTPTAPFGLVAASFNKKAPVSKSVTSPSSLGRTSTFWLVLIQLRLGPIPAVAPPPLGAFSPPLISFLKDPRPRFMVMVDRRVVTPIGIYASAAKSIQEIVTMMVASFILMIVVVMNRRESSRLWQK
mmetsp:Transcript_17027/g.41474  ORF Transcript_17027/g.41474 Transcript_17027/m.41474 type:complete len:223 (+) Transcript_17027:110-778(+)